MIASFQGDMSFDLMSPIMNAGYPNPTAQSTPVTGNRNNLNQRATGNGNGGVSSMLTTPNNSVLSLIQEAGVEVGSLATMTTTADATTPKSSLSQRNSPIRNQLRLSDAPRTPTPFKRALADVYQRCEPLSNTVGHNILITISRYIYYIYI